MNPTSRAARWALRSRGSAVSTPDVSAAIKHQARAQAPGLLLIGVPAQADTSRHKRAQVAGATSALIAGKQSRTTQPCCSALSMCTWPPCSSTKRRT